MDTSSQTPHEIPVTPPPSALEPHQQQRRAGQETGHLNWEQLLGPRTHQLDRRCVTAPLLHLDGADDAYDAPHPEMPSPQSHAAADSDDDEGTKHRGQISPPTGTPRKPQQQQQRPAPPTSRPHHRKFAHPPAVLGRIFEHAESYQERFVAGELTQLLDFTSKPVSGVVSTFGERFGGTFTVDTTTSNGFQLPGGNDRHAETFDVITIGAELHQIEDLPRFVSHVVAPLLRVGGVFAAFRPRFELLGAHASVADELNRFLDTVGCLTPADADQQTGALFAKCTAEVAAVSQGSGLELVHTSEFRATFPAANAKRMAMAFVRRDSILAYERKFPDATKKASASNATEYYPGCDVLAVFEGKLVAAGPKVDAAAVEPLFILRKANPLPIAEMSAQSL